MLEKLITSHHKNGRYHQRTSGCSVNLFINTIANKSANSFSSVRLAESDQLVAYSDRNGIIAHKSCNPRSDDAALSSSSSGYFFFLLKFKCVSRLRAFFIFLTTRALALIQCHFNLRFVDFCYWSETEKTQHQVECCIVFYIYIRKWYYIF